MNPLKALPHHGQAVWLDFLARRFIAEGGLKRLVDEDDLRGVTSNPAIFEKAIADSSDYDDAVAAALARGDLTVGALYEHLAMADIRQAADVMRPVHAATGGADGYVSLEVSPYLANDTEGTIAEARRFWREVGRDNLMVKVPATEAGLSAIRTLIGEGININVTLLFAQDVYRRVAEAYIGGLTDLAARGGDVTKVASVASFFVSRIDTAVDALIDAADQSARARLAPLKGRVAVANAKLAYQIYLDLFGGEAFAALKAAGARAQRLLWASTGTKNKAYSDVLYVEELIGADTVNTMPPATMDAFRDHGRVRDTLTEDIDAARDTLARLADGGIDLNDVAAKLLDDGVRLFADAADKLLGAVARKRAYVLGLGQDSQSLVLPPSLADAVTARADEWRRTGAVRRLWDRDASLWTGADEPRWLDWLGNVPEELDRVEELEAFQREVRERGFSHALLIGMGGSSLGPEVLAETFGSARGFPRLTIIDSTDPGQIRATEARIDLRNTLFIVSSKSGSTLEPNVLKDYFFDKVGKAVGRDEAGQRFVAITDPGSSMEKVAKADGFWRIFHGKPGIGGRYSILSRFGLVPAAVIGMDVRSFLLRARRMLNACGRDVPPADNPGVMLGLALGEAVREGRDKLTLAASPEIATFGAWAEQLVAESTGKHGKAIIPVDGEPAAPVSCYGNDRIFLDLRLAGEPAPRSALLDELAGAGHPIVHIVLAERLDLAQEFVRLEIATAIAGAVMGINPFDQPDVEASKIKTRDLTAAYEAGGTLPEDAPLWHGGEVAVYADAANSDALRHAVAGGLDAIVKAHLDRVEPGDYVALLAYLARDATHEGALRRARAAILRSLNAATCRGFGPRFLHSTGQAYKGGPNSGVFIQITATPAADLAIPGRRASFAVVEAAQAQGDLGVLSERGRRVVRLHLASPAAIERVVAAIERATA